MKFIENTFESPLKKMVYFSDGSAAQYKNLRLSQSWKPLIHSLKGHRKHLI
jgi:hypothetical protein